MKGSTEEELIQRYLEGVAAVTSSEPLSEAEVKALEALLVGLTQTPRTGAEVTDPYRQRGFAPPPLQPIPQSPPIAGRPAGRRSGRPANLSGRIEARESLRRRFMEIDREIKEIEQRRAQGDEDPEDARLLGILKELRNDISRKLPSSAYFGN